MTVDRQHLEEALAQALYDQGMGDHASDLAAARAMDHPLVQEALAGTMICLTSCGCDGRRRASECSGPYPPDSPVDGCRRCRR